MTKSQDFPHLKSQSSSRTSNSNAPVGNLRNSVSNFRNLDQQNEQTHRSKLASKGKQASKGLSPLLASGA